MWLWHFLLSTAFVGAPGSVAPEMAGWRSSDSGGLSSPLRLPKSQRLTVTPGDMFTWEPDSQPWIPAGHLPQVKSELWQWPLLSPPASLSTTVSCSVMSDSWTVARQAPLSMEFFRQEYIPFFRGSSWPRDRTRVSYTAGGSSTFWATMEARENSGKQISCSLLNFQSRFRTVPLSSQIPGTPQTVPSTQLTVPVLSGIVHASPSV